MSNEKILIGKKGNDKFSGYVFSPYIKISEMVLPIKMVSWNNGNPIFTKQASFMNNEKYQEIIDEEYRNYAESLRTQRRTELRLELDIKIDAGRLKTLLDGLHGILDLPSVKQSSVLMSDITAVSFVIICEYYTEGQTIDEFNRLKQDVNLMAVRLLEELGIRIAGDREFWVRKQP